MLFIINKQKPVGTQFGQKVNTNSLLGNSVVGKGVYHSHNSIKLSVNIMTTETSEWSAS